MSQHVIYQATNYSPELVTGVFVRVEGKRGAYRFKVFEAASCNRKNSKQFGMAGMGYTLREYFTDGDELPEEFKALCIKSKTTEKLK